MAKNNRLPHRTACMDNSARAVGHRPARRSDAAIGKIRA